MHLRLTEFLVSEFETYISGFETHIPKLGMHVSNSETKNFKGRKINLLCMQKKRNVTYSYITFLSSHGDRHLGIV